MATRATRRGRRAARSGQGFAVLLLRQQADSRRRLPRLAAAEVEKRLQAIVEIWKDVIEAGTPAASSRPASIPIVRHCIHGALDFVPFWYHPEGKYPPEEAFGYVADTVLRMLGVSASASAN